jgi:hypothetical protein
MLVLTFICSCSFSFTGTRTSSPHHQLIFEALAFDSTDCFFDSSFNIWVTSCFSAFFSFFVFIRLVCLIALLLDCSYSCLVFSSRISICWWFNKVELSF